MLEEVTVIGRFQSGGMFYGSFPFARLPVFQKVGERCRGMAHSRVTAGHIPRPLFQTCEECSAPEGAGFPHLAWHSRSESGDCQRGARRIGTGSCRSRVVTRESSCPALVFSSRRDELEREKQGRREGGRGKRKRGNAGRPVSGFRALLQIGTIIDKASVLRK